MIVNLVRVSGSVAASSAVTPRGGWSQLQPGGTAASTGAQALAAAAAESGGRCTPLWACAIVLTLQAALSRPSRLRATSPLPSAMQTLGPTPLPSWATQPAVVMVRQRWCLGACGGCVVAHSTVYLTCAMIVAGAQGLALSPCVLALGHHLLVRSPHENVSKAD